jgi:hypothetical protein
MDGKMHTPRHRAPERDRPTDATYAHSARAVEALITSLGL